MCGLYINFTQRTYSVFHVQYNDALIILLIIPNFCSAFAMLLGLAYDAEVFAAACQGITLYQVGDLLFFF